MLRDTEDIMSRNEEVQNYMDVVAIGSPIDIIPEFSVGDTVYMSVIKGKQVIGDDGSKYLITNISSIDAVLK